VRSKIKHTSCFWTRNLWSLLIEFVIPKNEGSGLLHSLKWKKTKSLWIYSEAFNIYNFQKKLGNISFDSAQDK
jgi:hypothetical protein